MIQGHGSDKHLYNREIRADFSSNVWYKGYPEGLEEALLNKMKDMVHYPEPEAESLRSKLARLHELKENQVIVGNGSVELFYLLAQTFRSCKSAIVVPAFAEYEDACRMHDHEVEFLSFEQLHGNLSYKLVWFGNPNNPDGNIMMPETVLDICRNNPNTIFMVDEAYAELSYSFRSVIPQIDLVDNLVIMHSLTKTFAMPGIRLGYAVGAAKLIEQMRSYRIPWTVNSLAIEAGHYILKAYQRFLPDTKQLKEESQIFCYALKALNGMEVNPSSCNYFLCKLEQGESSELKKFLVENYGLLIRDASNFKSLSNKHFRVAMQSRPENELLINGLRDYLCRNRKETTKEEIVEKLEITELI